MKFPFQLESSSKLQHRFLNILFMSHLPTYFKLFPRAIPVLLACFLAGCGGGGGMDPILGGAAVGQTAGAGAGGLQVAPVAPRIASVSPSIGAVGLCPVTTVSATFDKAMDAATINGNTFQVMGNGASVPGTVSYDPATRVARFVPTAAAGFAASSAFVATVKSGNAGVKDQDGLALLADVVWSFTTGAKACVAPVNLRSSSSFGGFGGGAGVTNQGVNTVVNGKLGTTAACTLITGFHDASNTYTETPLNIGAVNNGAVFCAPPAPGTAAGMTIATQAAADARQAYNELAALPAGSDPGAGQLGGRVLPPAIYTSAGGSFAITTGDLTLDAQGDPNAVWVFQVPSALTVGLGATPRQVLLTNGAQAQNVFWQVGSAARIEDGSSMVGTIIAVAGVTISTAGQTAQTVLTGRALGLSASVTMVNTTVVAP